MNTNNDFGIDTRFEGNAMHSELKQSYHVCDDDVIWKFLPTNRSLDLLVNQRLHFSKTKYMNDAEEGFSSIKQIKEVSDLDSDESIAIDELSKIRDHVLKNKAIISFILSALNPEENENIYDLFDSICADLNLSKIDILRSKYQESATLTNEYEAFVEGIESAAGDYHEWNFTRTKLQSRIDFIKDHTFLCCWNHSDEINMLLWEAYAKDLHGIAIKTTCKKLIFAVDRTLRRSAELSDCKIYIEKVKYNNQPNFLFTDIEDDSEQITPIFDVTNPILNDKYKFAKESLSYKTIAYRGEEEIRAIAINEDENISEGNIYILLEKDDIDEIHLNPFLSRPQEYGKIIQKLLQKFYNHKIPILYKNEILHLED